MNNFVPKPATNDEISNLLGEYLLVNLARVAIR
jgi:hypothetical protein